MKEMPKMLKRAPASAAMALFIRHSAEHHFAGKLSCPNLLTE